MGNVRHFRRIHKNDAPFLKACVFFAEFAETNIFHRNCVIFVTKNNDFLEFYENDARFPWVEFVDSPKNSLDFYETHTFSEKGRHFCEFCENDARFPWVEFVDFRKIGGWGVKGG